MGNEQGSAGLSAMSCCSNYCKGDDDIDNSQINHQPKPNVAVDNSKNNNNTNNTV